MKLHNKLITVSTFMLFASFLVACGVTVNDSDSTSESKTTPTSSSSSSSTSSSEKTADPHKGHRIYHYAEKAPTCEESGNKEVWYCVNHKEYYSTKVGTNITDSSSSLPIEEKTSDYIIPALGHEYGDWHVSQNPTCTEKGIEIRECSRCDHVAERYTDPTGHHYEEVNYSWNDSKTTFTASAVCVDDGHMISESVTVNNSLTIIEEPTCTEHGHKIVFPNQFKNVVLKMSEIESCTAEIELEPLGHDLEYKAAKVATCTLNGNIEHWHCKRCGDNFASETSTTPLSNVVIESSGHNFTTYLEVPATCLEKGTKAHKKCDICGVVTDLDGHYLSDLVIPALDHEWSTNTDDITFSLDETDPNNITVTARTKCTRSGCAHTLEEVKPVTKIVEGEQVTYNSASFMHSEIFGEYYSKTVTNHDHSQHITSTDVHNPTCTEAGYTVYTCECGEVIIVPGGSASGHDTAGVVPVYEWNQSQCEASITCRTCHEKVIKETVNATVNITAATCEVAGNKTYTATFTNPLFSEQTKNETISALGHIWTNPNYEWDIENNQITAHAVCSRDANHPHHLDETVAINGEVILKATCTANGKIVYTSEAFTDPIFSVQNKEETIPMLGHDYTNPVYEWNDDHSILTITKTCSHSEEHKDVYKVESTYEVTTASTCSSKGVGTYSATFEEHTETFNVDIAKLPHTYGNRVVVWDIPNMEATATVTCSKCSDDISQTVDITKVEVPATEETEGSITYTAIFTTSEVAGTVTKVEVIPVIGHTHSLSHTEGHAATCTQEGNIEYWYCSGCGNYYSDSDATQLLTVDENKDERIIAKLLHTPGDPVNENEVAPTCTEDGSHDVVIYCSVCHEEISRTPFVDEAIGHDYGEVSYTWVEFGNTFKVTATRTCENDPTHIETETVTVTDVAENPATCTDKGTITYTAKFENKAFGTDIKVVETEATGHSWSEWGNNTATCTEPGKETRECSSCHESEERPTEALGHDWGGWVGDTATCTEPGEEHRECSNCHELEYRDTEALGHDWSEVQYVWSNDYSKCTASRECLRDGCDKYEGEIADSTFITSKEPTCLEYGSGYYSATFENPAFGTCNSDPIQLNKFSHDFVNVYTWSSGSRTVGSENRCIVSNHATDVVEDAHAAAGTINNSLVTFTASNTNTSELINNVTKEQKSGDINIHFSNDPDGSGKGHRYYFEAKLRLIPSIEITDAKDLLLIKFDNSYYYGTYFWENSTEKSYAIFYTDLSGISDGDSTRFNDNISGYDSFGNILNKRKLPDNFLAFTADCYVTITANLDITTRTVTTTFEYESLVSEYLGQKYTQTFKATYSSKDLTDRNGVNSIRIARPLKTTTMTLESFVCSSNIDRNVFNDTNGSKATIVNYPGVKNAKY